PHDIVPAVAAVEIALAAEQLAVAGDGGGPTCDFRRAINRGVSVGVGNWAFDQARVVLSWQLVANAQEGEFARGAWGGARAFALIAQGLVERASANRHDLIDCRHRR